MTMVTMFDLFAEMALAEQDRQRQQFIWVCSVFNERHGNPGLPCSDACK